MPVDQSREQTLGAKLRRPALRAAVALFGPAVAGVFAPSGPEAAAIAARRPRASSTPRTVVFAMPLVGRHQVQDWQVIEDTLARTLATLRAQTDSHWIALICGQDRPDALPDDPRIRFIAFPEHPETHDKVPKLQTIVRALPQHITGPALYMPFDADDLLAPDAVANMQGGADGYLTTHGHILNAATGQIAPTAPRSLSQPSQKPFWKFCGSCAAFPVDLSDGARDIAFLLGLSEHEHRLYPHLAALAGIHLRPGPTPGVAYVIAHGENFETRRGRGGFKQRFTARHAVTDPAERAALLAHYCWHDTAADTPS